MANLQCCCLGHTSTSAATSYSGKPRQQLQESRGVFRRGVVNLDHNSKDASLVLLSCRSSCRAAVSPLGSTGSKKSSSHLCLAAAEPPSSPDSSIPADSSFPATEEESPKSFWQKWRARSAELRAKVSKWGLAAVLAYGLFDGITYTTFFVLAFLSYEKSTGQNPAANLKALLGVVVLMWGGNNVTRPFRVAGAAALAPFIDRGLKKMQEALKLPNQAFAFMICVATFACACFSVVAVLVLSRLGG